MRSLCPPAVCKTEVLRDFLQPALYGGRQILDIKEERIARSVLPCVLRRCIALGLRIEGESFVLGRQRHGDQEGRHTAASACPVGVRYEIGVRTDADILARRFIRHGVSPPSIGGGEYGRARGRRKPLAKRAMTPPS